ncbi:MAG TPA: peroxide stress protein YaaA [Saprospiraceae bacterium]|nr:peroxide stress protein YaaA [Saprospiraceae bacterium]
MLVLLSPSKNLHKQPKEGQRYNLPRFPDETINLIDVLKKQTPKSLQKLMDINDNLAKLNVDRYHQFTWPHTTHNAASAMYTFRGEVYLGLDANTMTNTQAEEADKRIRILSGLYGLLKPLDLIQPYRLEMGVELKVGKAKSLYEFWGSKITDLLNRDIIETKSKEIINLASQEYSLAIKPELLTVPIIDIQFLEERNGKLQFLSFIAKRTRGVMARFIVENKIKSGKDLQLFDVQGYAFRTDLSDGRKMVFAR